MTNIRSSTKQDKNKILNFCKETFSWGDYIHEVWDSWENDNGLLVVEENNTPIGMCHGVQYHNEKMLWIEGIRIHQDYRKHGYATELITHFEKIAITSGLMSVNMLIESENINSFTLAKKLGYEVNSQWNYFPLKSKKNIHYKIKFDQVDVNEIKNLLTLKFVESWRWIPFTKSNFKNLNSNQNILCLKQNNVVQSLATITESNSFEDTIILTIVFGTIAHIHKIIRYAQNLSAEKGYSKIRILTQENDLKMSDLGKGFPFYLMQKFL